MENQLLIKTLIFTASLFRYPLGRIFECPPALYLHIQKTAGSSIVDLLQKFYKTTILLSSGDYVGKQPDQLRHLEFIHGHFGYDYAKDLMPARYTFTFLRHPGERILSLYYFCRTRNPNQFSIYKYAQEVTLEKFLEQGLKPGLVRDHIWNHQAWQLAHGWGSLTNKTLEDFSSDEILDLARSHLQKFSYVGLTETFAADCKNILRALNVPPLNTMDIVNPTHSRLSIKEISPYAGNLLEELTRLDQKIYDDLTMRRMAHNRPAEMLV